MAEIYDTGASGENIPQEQQNWSQGTSQNGKPFTYTATDESGNNVDDSKNKDEHGTDASGPPFDNHKVNWNPDGQWHDTDPETRAKTAIYKYQFRTDGPAHYTLEFWTSDTYNYTFFSRVDSYGKDVYVTRWSHSVGMFTMDPTITSISGR